jgi:DNA (cytosine-5)-methyltransferase 1
MKSDEKTVSVTIYDARGNGGGGVSPTITGDHQNRITDYTAIVLVTYEDRENIVQQGEDRSVGAV